MHWVAFRGFINQEKVLNCFLRSLNLRFVIEIGACWRKVAGGQTRSSDGMSMRWVQESDRPNKWIRTCCLTENKKNTNALTK